MYDMWVRDLYGDLVNMSQMSYVAIVENYSQEAWELVAYGQKTHNVDCQDSYTLMIGTESQCAAALAALPMPIAWSAGDYLQGDSHEINPTTV